MTEPAEPFRQKLLDAQQMSPTHREAYRSELDAMLHPAMTVRSALPGTVLLATLLVMVVLIIRTDWLHVVSPLMLVAHGAMVVAFLWASKLIIHDLRRCKHSRQSTFSIAGLLTGAAGTLTVIALLMGLTAPSDPKSLFGAFYVFVFYFACAIWSIESRIATAELAAREQALRIEYRLVELGERLGK
jgi:hypothetical protein